jgi:iron complex transport system substrate-binding protein
MAASAHSDGESNDAPLLPLIVRDVTGTELTIRPPVTRAVSLVPSVTESIFGLGAGVQLVGRTRYCIHPFPEVAEVERIGGTKDPNIARIVALKPDLVVANREENLREHIEALRGAGIPVWVDEPKTPDDALKLVAFLGMAFDRIEEAAQVVLAGELALASLRQAQEQRDANLAEWRATESLRLKPRMGAAAPPPSRVRVAALIWNEPMMAAGAGTYIDGMLSEMGCENVFASRERYPEANAASLASADPALILLPSEPYEFKEADADALAQATADAGGRSAPEHAHNVATWRTRMLLCTGEDLMWYGTRTPGALTRLAKLIWNREVHRNTNAG